MYQNVSIGSMEDLGRLHLKICSDTRPTLKSIFFFQISESVTFVSLNLYAVSHETSSKAGLRTKQVLRKYQTESRITMCFTRTYCMLDIMLCMDHFWDNIEAFPWGRWVNNGKGKGQNRRHTGYREIRPAGLLVLVSTRSKPENSKDSCQSLKSVTLSPIIRAAVTVAALQKQTANNQSNKREYSCTMLYRNLH